MESYESVSWGWQFDTTWYWKHPPVTPGRLKQILWFHLQMSVVPQMILVVPSNFFFTLSSVTHCFPFWFCRPLSFSSALITGLHEFLAPGPQNWDGLHHLLLLAKLTGAVDSNGLDWYTQPISILCRTVKDIGVHLHACLHALGRSIINCVSCLTTTHMHKHLSLTDT